QRPELAPKSEAPALKAETPQLQEPQKKAPPEEFQPIEGEKEERIIIETSLYRAVWSNKGAVLHSWQLKEHKDFEGEDIELVSIQAKDRDLYPFSLNTEDPSFDRVLNHSFFKSTQQKLELTQGREGSIVFQFANEEGTKVEKIFTFRDGRYDFDFRVKVWKAGQEIEPNLLWGPSIGNPTLEEQKKRFGGGRGVAAYSGDKVFHVDENKYKPEQSVFSFIQWAGYEDQYFTALFLTSPQNASATFIQDMVEQQSFFYLAVNHTEKAYIGPKQYDSLKNLGFKTTKIIKYGFFGFIAEILYIAIKEIHNVLPNWGLSIILLTIIIKVIFFPLTYSSTKSMAKMQELQPKVKSLRAKYKKAKQDINQRRKMNEEMMALYKEHGVNPAGGCLPMLIQLPVFWGFFRLLIVSIEFRHSPFFLWITDLSIKDPFYVTPILMGLTQFISQKMTPTSADPTQQRMMLIMPVIMTIFFMNFPSGLVLYWLTNNILQIGQQYLTNRFMHKKKRESHGKKRKK
ncbi:MAG: membrane protein insertase YidC, partial [Candidatus Aminicenantes bacterium]|nr:membrane protein insertase YidC [Candidatus Aminicenantes bacterium]